MNTRRKFLSVAGLAVAGASIPSLRAQSPPRTGSRAERDVFRVISHYGSRESVTRSPGSTGTVAITVRVRSREAFAETFTGPRGLPFDRIRAAGNTLRFRYQGVEFLVENLA